MSGLQSMRKVEAKLMTKDFSTVQTVRSERKLTEYGGDKVYLDYKRNKFLQNKTIEVIRKHKNEIRSRNVESVRTLHQLKESLS